MAVVFNPLLSQEAHGKVGGTEFRQIRGRSIAGRVSLATPQRTLHTNAARQHFDHAVKAWRALTDADRALWAAAATSPELGFQLWTQRACIGLAATGNLPSLQSDPRPDAYIELFMVAPATGDPPTIGFTWDIYNADFTRLLFYWQPQQRTSSRPSKWRWLLLGSTYTADNSVVFPTPSYEESCHIKARLVSPYSGEVYHEYSRAHLL